MEEASRQSEAAFPDRDRPVTDNDAEIARLKQESEHVTGVRDVLTKPHWTLPTRPGGRREDHKNAFRVRFERRLSAPVVVTIASGGTAPL